MIRLGGDETPRRPLAAVLEWSAARRGLAVGGCVVLSRRHEPVTWAWGCAGTEAPEADARLARRMQQDLFSPSRPSELARSLDADPAQAPVVALDLTEHGPGAARLGDLLASRRLDAPLLAVLRPEGRVAAVFWLCLERDGSSVRSESARALGGVQPLLEQMEVTAQPESCSCAASDALGERHLTPRELVIAQLAVAGASNTGIAAQLGISQRTVKNHMTRVLAKCGVRFRTQLIALYGADDDRMGLLGEPPGTLE